MPLINRCRSGPYPRWKPLIAGMARSYNDLLTALSITLNSYFQTNIHCTAQARSSNTNLSVCRGEFIRPERINPPLQAAHCPLCLVGNIIHRQQDQLRFAGLVDDAAGVKQHLAAADAGKIMFHRIIFKNLVVRQDGLQQVSQSG